MKICIFGASGNSLAQEYFRAAHTLGAELAKKGHVLVFGGSIGGLIGECAKGAREQGGQTIGIAPHFFDEPGVLDRECTDFIFTDDINSRKSAMLKNSDAIIVLPGGIGTMEELFEALTAKQLGQHAKPLVLLNTLGYYDRMAELLKFSSDQGFISKSCLTKFTLCDRAEQAIIAVEAQAGQSAASFSVSSYYK